MRFFLTLKKHWKLIVFLCLMGSLCCGAVYAKKNGYGAQLIIYKKTNKLINPNTITKTKKVQHALSFVGKTQMAKVPITTFEICYSIYW